MTLNMFWQDYVHCLMLAWALLGRIGHTPLPIPISLSAPAADSSLLDSLLRANPRLRSLDFEAVMDEGGRVNTELFELPGFKVRRRSANAA